MNRRTREEKNEIIIRDNYAEVVLCNVKGVETGRALIDLDDIEKIKGYQWCLKYKSKHSQSYVYNGKRSLDMHRFIMNAPTGAEVDHINHNALDNRKSNLRICSHRDNVHNSKGPKSNNTTGAIGVYFDKRRQNYIAYIICDKKRIYLGSYNDKLIAANARIEAERKYFGNYVTANPIKSAVIP